MDGTSFDEFRLVDNIKYSEEIIAAARAAYDPEKLKALKEGENLNAFLEESRKQALTQWHADQALAVHSDMFRVLCQISAGEILNMVEARFGKKSLFTEWLSNNFDNRHIRYFQQAKQLADIGDFAKEIAAVGKNRILSLESLRKVEKKRDCLDLFHAHPFPDMTDDDDGREMKKHVDAVISLHRLMRAGIRFATFENAATISSTLNEAMPVKKADEVQKWLLQHEESQRSALFAHYVQDQLTFPSDAPYVPAPKESLNKILADFLDYSKDKIQDTAWVETQRKIIDINTLITAQQLLVDLIEKLKPEK